MYSSQNPSTSNSVIEESYMQEKSVAMPALIKNRLLNKMLVDEMVKMHVLQETLKQSVRASDYSLYLMIFQPIVSACSPV